MASTPPLIQGQTLTYQQSGQPAHLLVDTADWYVWLRTASIFTFHSEHGTFTARKERAGSRRGGEYWKAYRRHHGKLYRVYLGKSEGLTLEQLKSVAAVLASKGEGDGSLDVPGLGGGSRPSSKASSMTSTYLPQATGDHSPHEEGIKKLWLASLPVPLTALIGRQQEVRAICDLLSHPEVRLLTITGTGGVGKTRLALQIAEELLDDFADGPCFVPLAPIRDPALVVSTIAQTLDLKEAGQQLMLGLLQAFLRDKQLLLLLDNFEQVLSAARQVAELLAACPRLKVLVTSRERLHMRAEHEFAVPPLALPDPRLLPDPAALSQSEAVTLFLERAQAIRHDFQLTAANARTIAEICTRLDGLPLAIELAAARIKLLSPQALLARLSQRLQVLTSGARDVPVRHQTLRHTIAWSYSLLDAQEQCLFRRLAVFVGGCTLEAVEAVSTVAGDTDADVLEGMASLLDKSLLHRTERDDQEPRFGMLETIREYGQECLKLNEEEEITRQAHASCYVAMLEKMSPNLYGPQHRSWLDLLEKEHNNLRAALQWSLERKDVELALRLSDGLSWFWHLRGYQVEGRQWLDRVLVASEDAMPSLRVQVLHGATRLAMHQGDFYQAQEMSEKMLMLCRGTGDRQYMSRSLRRLGEVADMKHNYAVASSLFEESVDILRAIMKNHRPEQTKDIKRNLGYALTDLASLISYQGDFARADILGEEGLALFRELNDWGGIIFGLGRLAKIRIAEGNYGSAYAVQEEALSRAKEMNHMNDASLPHLLGQLAFYQGDDTTATRLLKETLAPYTALGNRWRRVHVLVLLAYIAAFQGDDGEAHALCEECLATLKALDDQEAIAALLEDIAEVVIHKSPVWGVQLWGCAEALREVIDIPFSPMEYFPYKRSLAAAQASLGKPAFAAAWAEGRTMTYQQALAAYRPTAKTVSTSPPRSRVPYPNELSNREIEVLRLVALGLTDAQVAEQLVISPRTVNTHLKSIYGKIGVTSRSAATRYAMEHRLV